MNWKTSQQVGVQQLIAQGPILIAVLANREFFKGDLVLPEYLFADADKGPVILRIGHGLTPTIADLDVEHPLFLSGTLMFRGEPFKVKIPWDAIAAITLDTGELPVAESEPDPKPADKRGHLKLVN